MVKNNLAKRKYITQQVLDQLREAVRQRDDDRFHAILTPLKAVLPIQKHPDFLREVFAALEETKEWSDFRWEEQLKREGYSAAQIAAIFEEERQFESESLGEAVSSSPEEGGTAFGSPKPAGKKRRGLADGGNE
jgi:hypothetical protein